MRKASANKNDFLKAIYTTKIEKIGKFYSFQIKNIETGEIVDNGNEKTAVEATRVCNRRHLKLEHAARAQREAEKEAAEKAQAEKDAAEALAKIEVKQPKVKKASTKGWSAKRHANEEEDELQCTNCGEILSFDDFYNDRTNVNGKQNHCKGCIKEHGQKRRAAAKAAKAAENPEFSATVLEAFNNVENLPAVVQH
jgi:Pyruvate/2-oxoacid:ferredoxin oxidoreductase delta subunit